MSNGGQSTAGRDRATTDQHRLILQTLLESIHPTVAQTLFTLQMTGRWTVVRAMGSTHDVARSAVASAAMMTPCEWFAWLDGDVLATPAQVDELVDTAAASGSTILAAPVMVRGGGWPAILAPDLDPDEMLWGERGRIYEVCAAGFGLVVTHRSVFQDIQDQVPAATYSLRPGDPTPGHAFFMPLVDEDGRHHTEDYSLCLRARRAGHHVRVDTRVAVPHWSTSPMTVEGWRIRREKRRRP